MWEIWEVSIWNALIVNISQRESWTSIKEETWTAIENWQNWKRNWVRRKKVGVSWGGLEGVWEVETIYRLSKAIQVTKP